MVTPASKLVPANKLDGYIVPGTHVWVAPNTRQRGKIVCKPATVHRVRVMRATDGDQLMYVISLWEDKPTFFGTRKMMECNWALPLRSCDDLSTKEKRVKAKKSLRKSGGKRGCKNLMLDKLAPVRVMYM
jgi:hypothetical protein